MTATPGADRQHSVLASYLPELVEHWHQADAPPRLIEIEGTVVSADISGFTALSERLAGLGHEGAEELTDLLNRCFTQMIDASDANGGDVVKFGGDALLILFHGPDHAPRAVRAMTLMRQIVAQRWSTNSVARVELGISQGAHSGTYRFSIVDGGHLELFAAGPAVTATVECESDAGRGNILVSAAMAELLPGAWLGDLTETGAVHIRHRRVDADLGVLEAIERRPRGVPGLDRYLAPALAEQVVVGSPGEHRMVSVAFLAVGGTDELAESEGPEALHAALETITDGVRDVLASRRVHWLASDAYVNGGKIILTAGAPTSTSEDEDQMLLALHEIMRRPAPLPIKVGVNRGRVFFGDLGSPTRRTFTVMGDAVNLAARLMQKAAPGQIVASKFILDQATTKFEVDELEPFMVKGKSAPIEAAVLGSPVHADDDDHTQHRTELPFVGRARELADLGAMAESALAGSGRFLELSGQAGIGKTRLIAEVLDRHPELTPVFLRGGQYARNSPYFVVRRLIRQVVGIEDDDDPVEHGRRLEEYVAQVAPEQLPWLPLLALVVGVDVEPTPEVDRLAEQFRRERLLSTTVDVLDAAGRGSPAAIVAEDAYWFDEASQEVLQEMSRRVTRRPWFIVATLRPESDPIVSTDLPGVTRLDLLPLDDADTEELARAAGDLEGASGIERRIGELATRAGGHPLFVLELVAAAGAGDDALPESIESLVTTRIDTLAPADRLLLREAAVGGAVIDPPLLATALDRTELAAPARWSGLSDFLQPEGPRLRFRHALYQDVAYQGLSYRRRREVHQRLGETIEQSTQDITDTAPLLSLHFHRSGDHDRAWTYSELGADAARAAYANTEAISLYERALDAGARSPHVDRPAIASVAERLADVYVLDAQYDSAFATLQRARKLGGTDPSSEARRLRKIGHIRRNQGSYSQALRWYGRSLRAIDHVLDASQRRGEEAEITLGYAGTLHRQGRNREAATWAERARAAAEAAGDDPVLAAAYNMLDVVSRALGRADDGYTDAALRLFHEIGDLVGEANVLNNIGVRAYFAGEWTEAAGRYERSLALRRQAGDVAGEGVLANNLAELLSYQGHHDRAIELLHSATRQMRSAGYRVGAAYAGANLAMARARSGDLTGIEEALDEARSEFEQIGAGALTLEIDVRQIELLLLEGHTRRASELASVVWAQLNDDHDGNEELTVQLAALFGLALTAGDDAGRAEAVICEAIDLAVAAANRYCEGLAWHARAVLDEVRGCATDAATHRANELLNGLDVIAEPPVVTRTREVTRGVSTAP